MTTILVLYNEFTSYTVESELPEQLIQAYTSVGIEAFIMPNYLLEQAM
jgi:hypothetical protein